MVVVQMTSAYVGRHLSNPKCTFKFLDTTALHFRIHYSSIMSLNFKSRVKNWDQMDINILNQNAPVCCFTASSSNQHRPSLAEDLQLQLKILGRSLQTCCIPLKMSLLSKIMTLSICRTILDQNASIKISQDDMKDLSSLLNWEVHLVCSPTACRLCALRSSKCLAARSPRSSSLETRCPQIVEF